MNGAREAERWEGYVDWRNRPATRGRHGGMLAASFVLVVEVLENLAFLANASNLVTYLMRFMHYSPAQSATTVTNFMGTAFLLALLGGFLSDAFFTTYTTYLVSAFVEFMGLIILTIQARTPSLMPAQCAEAAAGAAASCAPVSGAKKAMLFAGLYLTALGVGGIKGSLPPHGAEQFDEHAPRGRKGRSTFFNYFVFCLSCGALVAVTFAVWVEDNKGWQWGFGISTIAILLSVPVFAAGSGFYRNKVPTGSPLTTIAKVVIAAALAPRRHQQRRCHRPRAQPDGEHRHEGVLQARGHRRGRRRGGGRAVAGAHVPEPRRAVPAAARAPDVHGAGGGGRQGGAHGAAHLLLHHHAQQLPGAAVHVLGRAGGYHGHARGDPHRAGGVAAGVSRHLHPPPRARLRPRHHPVHAPRDGDGDGHLQPPADRGRAGPLHRRHGGGRRRRGEAQERGGGRRDAGLGEAAAHHLLLDRVPVPVPGVGGPVHAGGAARVLLQRGAAADAVAGDVAVVGVAGAGVLPELGAGDDREQRDGARRAPGVAAGGQPEPLPPREVLLGHVRAQHAQLHLLPLLGDQVQVQKRREHQGVVPLPLPWKRELQGTATCLYKWQNPKEIRG